VTSILETDGYKFSMAEAGWPLRQETFYYSHRKGGPMVLPVDVRKFIKARMPFRSRQDEIFLESQEYSLGIGALAALEAHESVKIWSLNRNSIFYPGEPVFTLTGPSALVSWFEPILLQLNFVIQVATLALTDQELFKAQMAVRNSEHEVLLIKEILDLIGVKAPPMEARPEEYRKAVTAAARALIAAVEDPTRLFEVGLRSATCPEMHQIALEGCQAAGITRTSSVWGAHKLSMRGPAGMKAVGTMGHEHVMRYGNDEAAFRAMRDRRPYRSSYLLDTFDTFLSGIPAAFRVMAENPRLGDSIRYDSGNKEAQYLFAEARAREMGLEPVHILEDAFTLEQTVHFEALRKQLGVPATRQFYGYGGALVAKPAFGDLHRDKVAAVYKLSQTGPKAVMKFGNEANGAKMSIPGRPVVWRRIGAPGDEPPGIIAQEGEKIERGGYSRDWVFDIPISLNGIGERLAAARAATERPVWSPETQGLREDLKKEARKSYA